MLTITALNIGGTDAVCNYDVHVYVCSREIWHGIVKGHTRAAGWETLAELIAAKARTAPTETIQHGSECPVCKKPGIWL